MPWSACVTGAKDTMNLEMQYGRQDADLPSRWRLAISYETTEAEASQSFAPFPAVPWPFGREWLSGFRSSQAWRQKVDVIDAGDAIIIMAELPGVEVADIHIQMVGNTLTISGERHLPEELEAYHFYLRECSYGPFRRDIQIPAEVEPGEAYADFDNGVLAVTLPKVASQDS